MSVAHSLSLHTDTGTLPGCSRPAPIRRCLGTVQPLRVWTSEPAPQLNVPPPRAFEERVGYCQRDARRGVRVFYPQDDARLLVFHHATDPPRETSLVGENQSAVASHSGNKPSWAHLLAGRSNDTPTMMGDDEKLSNRAPTFDHVVAQSSAYSRYQSKLCQSTLAYYQIPSKKRTDYWKHIDKSLKDVRQTAQEEYPNVEDSRARKMHETSFLVHVLDTDTKMFKLRSGALARTVYTNNGLTELQSSTEKLVSGFIVNDSNIPDATSMQDTEVTVMRATAIVEGAD
ncbi:hypothetical protein C8Q73DRAFT_669411 [Cubamyces lactineus]|nr:hypothetical protein C8Q73DRAFT_669411 [Cubamyces lactineus]